MKRAPLAVRAAALVDAGLAQSTRSELLAWAIRDACVRPASVWRRGRFFVVTLDPVRPVTDWSVSA